MSYPRTKNTLISMASSSKTTKGKEPVGSASGMGSGDESGCGDEYSSCDYSASAEFPSCETPADFYDSNGSYDSLEFQSSNWIHNRAMTPRWSDRPICRCGHSCTYIVWESRGEHYKKRYWNCPRFLNDPKGVSFVILLFIFYMHMSLMCNMLAAL